MHPREKQQIHLLKGFTGPTTAMPQSWVLEKLLARSKQNHPVHPRLCQETRIQRLDHRRRKLGSPSSYLHVQAVALGPTTL